MGQCHGADQSHHLIFNEEPTSMSDIDLSREHLYYGSADHRPPEPLSLQAGPLTCQYEASYLRYIRLGGEEILRMIYPAVRDHNWGTVLPEISDEQIEQTEDGFTIRYSCSYREGEIDFRVQYRIAGDHAGKISFSMEGVAYSTFRKNRIGFNILHPPQAAGQPYRVTHTDASEDEGAFPEQISPHQPVMDMQRFRWQCGDAWAELAFEGDIFEMEDQRNWTDASFKTYSTPLAIPFPVRIEKGNSIRQEVRLHLVDQPNTISSGDKPLSLRVTDRRLSLPAIGIGQSSEYPELTEEDAALLKKMHFSHYRVDLRLDDADLEKQWKRALAESRQLALPLELALHFGFETARHLGDLSDLLEADQPEVKHLLIFSSDHKITPESILRQVLPDLRLMFPDTAVGAGTDCFFTELNRERVENREIDFLTYSLNPQVHQFDNQSLVETLSAQAITVNSARAFAQGKPIHISPITLKMRFNPNATGPEPEVPEGQLPPQVDSRQMSLFGAGWTLGSMKYMVNSGPASVTYFETVGRRGLLHGRSAPQLPEKFPAFDGMIYPMYWVFYALLKEKEVQVLATESSHTLQMESLAWESGETRYLMLANLQPVQQKVKLEGWQDKSDGLMLDAAHFESMNKQSDYLETAHWEEVTLPLELSPYALLLLRERV